MQASKQAALARWSDGAQGVVRKTAEHKFEATGTATKTGATTVQITELGIGKWTQVYKAELEAMMEAEKEDGPKIKVTPASFLRVVILTALPGLHGTPYLHQRQLPRYAHRARDGQG